MLRYANKPMADPRVDIGLNVPVNAVRPTPLARGNFDLRVPALVAGLSPEEAELQNVIVSGWKSFASHVDITGFVKKSRWNPKQILACVRDAHYNHPEVFYLAPGINLELIRRTDGPLVKATLMDLKYDQKPSEYLVHKHWLDEAVIYAMSTIRGVVDEEEKALRLHDYLVHICDCDVTINDEKVYSTRARTAYSALVRRKAVCEGYAMAYRLLLNAAGIVSGVAIDRIAHHIWNYVRIRNRWYHVDVTWDNPVLIGAPRRVRRISHRHFLMSDKKARRTGHKSWDVSGLPSANDESFDSQYC